MTILGENAKRLERKKCEKFAGIMAWLSYLREYILNTSFHGFRFIAERNYHWTERVFWGLCCVLSWIASASLMRASWYDYKNNAISFVVETNYLDWNTNFPSVIACEVDNQNKLMNVTDQMFGEKHHFNLDEVIRELAYSKGQYFYTIEFCIDQADPNCPKTNFSVYADLVRSTCEEMFLTCKWRNKPFDCCKYFAPIDTELGVCYGINSIQARSKDSPTFDMASNRRGPLGSLYMEIRGQIYILGKQEVPSLATLQTDIVAVNPHLYYNRHFAVKEIENQPEVKYVSIEQRKCRFADESDIDIYKHYSYSACGVQCRKDAQIRICGCVQHLMPNTPPHLQCDLKGLACLHKNYDNLAISKPIWANRSGLVCDCLPSCTEMELSVVKDTRKGYAEAYAVVELTLKRLPSERFKRNVVRDRLDLVVSMGGATALFLGASILSFVELAYYFLIRPITGVIDKQRTKR